ncbi:TetR family transcriptional regulator [Yinghuangia aomiensis]
MAEAERLFLAQGYDKVSVRAVNAAAGMKPGRGALPLRVEGKAWSPWCCSSGSCRCGPIGWGSWASGGMPGGSPG